MWPAWILLPSIVASGFGFSSMFAVLKAAQNVMLMGWMCFSWRTTKDSCEAVKWNYCLVVVHLCAHTCIVQTPCSLFRHKMRCSDGRRASSLSSVSSSPRNLWWTSVNRRTKTCFATSQWWWPFTTLSPRGCLCHNWRNAFNVFLTWK